MEKIYPALKSIMDQTMPPRRIYLAVPPFSIREQKAYSIPEALYNCPAVQIIEAEKDWGPATKLIPALTHPEIRPDDSILVIDDDQICPARFLETFRQYAQKLPDTALSLRGWTMPRSLRWKDCRHFKGTSISRPTSAEVINGCGGILVKPKFFTDDFFDYDTAPRQAFFVDDIWISGNLAKRGIPRYVVPFNGYYAYLPSLSTLFSSALNMGENRGGGNDEAVIRHFRPYWKFEEASG
jgi:hypothetical protein